MYTQFFQLTHVPFSIAPDPHYVYMSERHREALAHLLYGVNGGGGFVLLTGEIGAGKTTICRCFLEQVPAKCNVAYIFNPKLTVIDLLRTICDEFHIDGAPASHPITASVKDYVDALNRFLLASYADGYNNVLIIDEAQNLSADVLEQLRLLTNLETNERKLLQIILIGQPELRTMLARPELEQLAQRIIARYHLDALSLQETAGYIQHRLTVAGLMSASPFPPSTIQAIHQITKGVPRRINLLCDRALLGAYAENRQQIDQEILGKAAREIFSLPPVTAPRRSRHTRTIVLAMMLGTAIAGSLWLQQAREVEVETPATLAAAPEADKPAVLQAGASNSPAVQQVANVASTTAPVVDIRDAGAAQRELARLWEIELKSGDPCQEARTHGLQCYASSAGFAELRQLDRPAVLTLHDESGKPYYGLLLGLNTNDAMVRVSGRTQTVSLVSLARRFDGEFMTFWRVPAHYRGHLAPGDRGADVDWLAAQLARLGGNDTPAADQTFNQQITMQVREFQFAQGLKVDGVVGPRTIMHLNRAAGLDEPRLQMTDSSGHSETN